MKSCPKCGSPMSWDDVFEVWYCKGCERKGSRRPYNRSQQLALTQLFTTAELADTSPAGRKHVIAKLEAAARADRRRALNGRWIYDLPRHRIIRYALEREREALAAIEMEEAA